MGLFDLPAPLFAWLDGALARILPDLLRVILWGAVGGIVSMLLFRALSRQQRLGELKREQRVVRESLDGYDGPMGEAWPLLGRMLGLSFRQVGLVLGPAIIASLPALSVIVWTSNEFGHRYPPARGSIQVSTLPDGLRADWSRDSSAPGVEVRDSDGELLEQVRLHAPVPVIHKRQWWNALIANPAGYLPDTSPVERLEIALPELELVPFGPAWLRTWEGVFFTALLVCSLALKFALRIE